MKNEWILDVLSDLRNFAHNNGFSVLAEQLDDTKLVAASELTSDRKGELGSALNDAGKARGLHRMS